MATIPSAPVPATLKAALRYLAAIILPIGVQKGWWGQSDVVNISAFVAAAGSVAWGLWKTHDRQKRLNSASPTLR